MQTRNYERQDTQLKLSQSFSSYNTIEASRKKLVNSMFCLVGTFFLCFFGLMALAKGLHGLAIFTLSNAFLAGLVFIYQKVSGNFDKAGYGVVCICVSLFLYLLITGGYDNTGPLWCYVLSILILFVLGEKRGLLINGILILYMIVAFSFEDSPLLVTSYSKEFELRYVATFIAIFIMAMIYERSHAMAKKAMAEMAEQLYTISRVDLLTGIYNRRAMRELMEYESLRVRRVEKTYSVLFLDIDFFKGINDKYGHDCGDFVLAQLADRLKGSLRNSDTVSRWGGEEFVVLLPETPREYVMAIGEKLRKAIEDKGFVYKNDKIPVTVSIGGASFHGEENIDDTINRADKHLYRAKKEGRNMVVV